MQEIDPAELDELAKLKLKIFDVRRQIKEAHKKKLQDQEKDVGKQVIRLNKLSRADHFKGDPMIID